MKTCSVEGCSKRVRARGWCIGHWTRWQRYGSPHMTKRVANGTLKAWLAQHANYAGDECLLWPFGRNTQGYGIVAHDGRFQLASRVMCEMVHGVPEAHEMQAAHSCGLGHTSCVNPRHLRWATPSENSRDRVVHGTDARGEKSPVAKLSKANVEEIVSLLDRATRRDLGKRFGVSSSTINDIALGRTWLSVTGRQQRGGRLVNTQ